MNIDLTKTQQYLEWFKDKLYLNAIPITHTTSRLPIVVPITAKTDTSGKTILDGNVLLGNITCISKARLGNYITDLSADEMKAVDKAISISLDINHHYVTLQNMYNDKMQYIEKLKNNRTQLQAELNAKQQQLYQIQKLLDKYHCTNIESLTKFLENSLPEK